MRVLYLDETGVDKRSKCTAVCGVLIDPDKDWILVSEQLNEIKKRVPPQFTQGFHFHATDLSHGGKYRRDWDEQSRWDMLDELISLPRKFGIPIICGTSKPVAGIEWSSTSSIISHSIAYAQCLGAANRYMLERTKPEEAAMVVVEERKEATKALRATQRLFSNSDLMDKYLPTELREILQHITRLKLPPAFASKDDDPLLSVADACAFAFHRFLNGLPGYDRLLSAMFGSAYPTSLGQFLESPSIHGYFLFAPDLR